MERFLVHVADGQVSLAIHDDTILVDLLNLGEVDDVGTVDAHEIVGQMFLHLLHGKEGDDGLGLALNPDFQILAHAFDVADVGDADLDDAVVGLEEDGVVLRG